MAGTRALSHPLAAGSDPTLLYLVLGAALVIALVVAVLLFRRRRSHGGT